jgi:hypothetical protein
MIVSACSRHMRGAESTVVSHAANTVGLFVNNLKRKKTDSQADYLI